MKRRYLAAILGAAFVGALLGLAASLLYHFLKGDGSAKLYLALVGLPAAAFAAGAVCGVIGANRRPRLWRRKRGWQWKLPRD